MNAPDTRPAIRGLRSGGAMRRRAGVVLPTVLVIMLTVCLVVGLVSRFSIRSMRLARRTLDVRRAFVVAEAGLGYGVMRARNLLVGGGLAGFTANCGSIAAPPSPDDEYELRLKAGLISASSSGGTVISEQGSIEVVAGARNLESGVSCALRVTISVNGESLSDYAVFFEGDLEATVGGSRDKGLVFRGKVHSNSDVYVSKFVEFEGNITCHGNFYHGRRNTADYDNPSLTRNVLIRYGDDNQMSASEKQSNRQMSTWDGTRYIDSRGGDLERTEVWDEWKAQSATWYGGAVQAGDGVPELRPPIMVGDKERAHALIDPPLDPDDAEYREDIESEKLANKAALLLHVNADGTYTLYDNVHKMDITSSLKQTEPYSPGYWKGGHSGNGQVWYWPGWWVDEEENFHGYQSKQELPSWFTNATWVSSYTPPQSDTDTRWLYNYPLIDQPGGFDLKGVENPTQGYSWANSDPKEGNPKNNNQAGYAPRTIYAKNPATGNYYLKNDGGIQTLRLDPDSDYGLKTLGNMFVDYRAGWAMAATDLYMDNFLSIPAVKSALNDAPGGDGISKLLYVDMDRTQMIRGEKYNWTQLSDGTYVASHMSANNLPYNIKGELHPLPCLRIRNASDLGTDLSIVCAQPVYVEGDFNTTAKGVQADGTPRYYDSMIAADRITQLSKNWQDANYPPCIAGWGRSRNDSDFKNNEYVWGQNQGVAGSANFNGLKAWCKPISKAVTSTINAVIMTGIKQDAPGLAAGSTASDRYDIGYSGGLENILRFHEDWSGLESRFNGSIICLWQSEKDQPWLPPGTNAKVFQAPKRVWGYSKMAPPGMPGFFAVREATWERVAWSSVDWGDGSSGGGGGGEGGEGGG